MCLLKRWGLLEKPMDSNEEMPPAAHSARGQVASAANWAELLKRVWGLDALECARCSGRMKAMAEP